MNTLTIFLLVYVILDIIVDTIAFILLRRMGFSLRDIALRVRSLLPQRKKKGKIAYVITFDDVDDYNEYHHIPYAFNKKEDAIQKLNELFDDADSKITLSWVREKDEMSFSFYENGYYCSNHYCAYIDVVELK